MNRPRFIPALALAIAFLAGCGEKEEKVCVCSPDAPSADDQITIQYRPDLSGHFLARSDSVLFRFTLIGENGELVSRAEPMERRKGGWRIRLRPSDLLSESPAVLVGVFCDSEDYEICDNNRGDPWVLRFRQNGLLVRGVGYQSYRLCKNEIRLPEVVGKPCWDELARSGLEVEVATHPDYLPARAALWLTELKDVDHETILFDSLQSTIEPALDALFDTLLTGDEPDVSTAELMDVCYKMDRVSKADSLIEKIRARFPGSPFAARCEFKLAIADDDEPPPPDLLEDLISRYPDTPMVDDARYFLFVIYNHLLREPEKVRELVLNGGSLHRDFRYQYSWTMINEGDLKGAEALIRRCLREAEEETAPKTGPLTTSEWEKRRETEMGDYLVHLAWIVAEDERYEEAVELSERVVSSMPRAVSAITLGNLAEYLEEVGREDEALRIYDRLGELFEPSTYTWDKWEPLFEKKRGKGEDFAGYMKRLAIKRRATKLEQLERSALRWRVPDVILTDLGGNEHNLSEFRGKVVLLDFWATWCGPCIDALPHVNDIAQTWSEQDDVIVMAVNTWEREPLEERSKRAQELCDSLGVSIPIYLDLPDAGDQNEWASIQFGVSAIPSTFILDREGNILFKHVGLSGEDDFENLHLEIEFAVGMGVPEAL